MKNPTTGKVPRWMPLIGIVTVFVVLTLAMAYLLLPSPVGTLQSAFANGDVTCPHGPVTLTDDIEGNLFVLDHTHLCRLEGVHVEGDIIVGHANVRLEVTDGSEVDGNIISPSGTVFVDDSSVDGNITVEECGGTITVKNSEIGGHVVLTGNGNVVVTDNSIDGNLDLIDNDAADVSGNDVDGNTTVNYAPAPVPEP